MSSHGTPNQKIGRGEHAGHGFWFAVACCVPLIVIFALIALRVI